MLLKSKQVLSALFVVGSLMGSPNCFADINDASIDDALAVLEESKENTLADKPVDDTLEHVNRPLYHFNRVIDGLLFRPLAVLWRDVVHDDIKKGVNNFISNLFMPIQTINLILQGEGAKAFESLFRFGTNSTVGLLGVMDPATEIGWTDPKTNFNETLVKWGVEEGPYVMVPFLGPMCMRSLVGIGVDWAMDPLRLYVNNTHHDGNHHGQEKNLYWGVYAVDFVSKRAELIGVVDDLDKNSPDTYVAIREYYIQTQRNVEEKVAKRRINNAAARS